MNGKEGTELSTGDFTKIVMLGYGGFGRVFLVERNSGTNKGKKYAMKTIWKPIHNAEIMAERNILQKIKGLPNLVQMHHAFTQETELHFILDFAGGGDLLQVVDNKKQLEREVATEYIAGAIRGIGGLHELNIIHRDIKLENILIDCRGFTMIADFGISKLGKNQLSTRCGTSAYHAPEIDNASTYDKTVDWWALGIVIYEIVSLKRHQGGFIDENFYKRLSPTSVLDLVRKFQEKDPKIRLGHGPNGTNDIRQMKLFKNDYWLLYAKSYNTKKHPNEEDTLEMVRNFSTTYTATNLNQRDDLFNYNNKRTIQAPVNCRPQRRENQQANQKPKNNSEYIDICDASTLGTIQAPVTRAQHRAKEIIYISDTCSMDRYVSGSTQHIPTGYMSSSQSLKRMHEETEPMLPPHHKK